MTNVWVLKENGKGFVAKTDESPLHRNYEDVTKAYRFESKNKASEWAKGNYIGDVTPIQVKLDLRP
jgi:hypothetical protein